MIVVDTDCGVDDICAISTLLTLNQVCGITIVRGNLAVNPGSRAVQLVVDMMNLKVPIYIGCDHPLIRCEKLVPSWNGHGFDGLGNYSETSEFKQLFGELPLVNSTKHAVEYLLSLEPGHTLVCLGPLTNIAVCLMMDPLFLTKFKQVFVMGGSLLSKGNSSMAAEFNFHFDPEAAHNVFQAKGPLIQLVTWETTVEHCFSWQVYDKINESSNKLSRLFCGILKVVHDMRRSPLMNDAVVNHFAQHRQQMANLCICDFYLVACLLDPAIVQSYHDCSLTVELQGKHSRGATFFNWMMTAEPNVRLLLKLDQVKLEEMLLKVFL